MVTFRTIKYQFGVLTQLDSFHTTYFHSVVPLQRVRSRLKDLGALHTLLHVKSSSSILHFPFVQIVLPFLSPVSVTLFLPDHVLGSLPNPH